MKNIAGGAFIVFSGPEGGGKTSTATHLAEVLTTEGYAVCLTKEPGGDNGICRDLRKILLNLGGYYDTPVADGMTEFLLFCGERRQHILTVILPALAEGKVVICDRYVPDTFAYQCVGRKAVTEEQFRTVMSMATRGVHVPDLTFWFDVPPELGLSRKAIQQELNRFELEKVPFHKQVADGFEHFFSRVGAEYRSIKVDCTQPQNEVFAQITTHAKEVINERRQRVKA